MEYEYTKLEGYVNTAKTGADAIKKAPIVSYPTNFRCLRIGDISNERDYSLWGYTEIDDKIFTQYQLKANDILIARTGNTIGVATVIKKDLNAVFNNGLIRLKTKENVNPLFLYYLVTSKRFKDFIYSISGGTSTQPNIKIRHLLQFEVPHIELEKQNRISEILNNLDSKIEANKIIIANLEELSQTLFKRWFIDFEFQDKDNKPYKTNNEEIETDNSGNLPKQWSIKKIKDIDCIVSDHVANGSFKSLKDNVHFTEKKEEQYALFARNIDLKSNLQNITKYVTKGTYQFLKKSRLFGGEVVISNVGDVGTIHRIPDIPVPMVLGNNQVFITSEEEYLNEYLYLYFKSHLGTHLINTITSGSAQMKFNKTDLRNSKLILPCKEDLNRLMKPLKIKLDYRDQLITENHKLTTLRDTLLPKLMSGEIELPDELEVDEHAELLQ